MKDLQTRVAVSLLGLEIQATTDPGDDIFDQFFAGYDQSFVLPSEKESREGFRECLSLNLDPRYRELSDLYGPFREIVFVASDPKSGSNRAVGAGNFICYPMRVKRGDGT